MLHGLYRFPAIHNNSLIFVCEDDLWAVSADGGRAARITAGVSDCSRPCLSPDGSMIAFTAKDEGAPEIYCMESTGGSAQRLTFLGVASQTAGWMPDGSSIILSSNTRQPFPKIRKLYSISPTGGDIAELPYGIANNISFGKNGGVLIGRNTADLAAWKRYRGGTAGMLWIDSNASGVFSRLLCDVLGNFACPMWIGDRIYFISDHEGIGNIYSCLPSGQDLRCETGQKEYFARNAATDGNKIVYHAGGDIFLLDPFQKEEHKINIEVFSHSPQRQRRFVDAAEYIDDYSIHPQGHYLALTSRGKPFVMGNWEGPVLQLGVEEGVRYRKICWLPDGERCIVVSDENGEECIELYNAMTSQRLSRFENASIGRPVDIEVNPKQPVIALTNDRLELLLINYETGEHRFLTRSEFNGIAGMAWSPDGEWLAYSFSATAQTFSLIIYSMTDDSHRDITESSFRDMQPSFDPEGKYLYFLSYREFNPVYDSMYFDLNFPRGAKPYLITLQRDTQSPFTPQPKPSETETKLQPESKPNADISDKQNDSDKQKNQSIVIDFDGISRRVIAFPVAEGKYSQIAGLKGKVLFLSNPIRGSLEESNGNSSDGTLEIYDFDQQKKDVLAVNVSNFMIAVKAPLVLYRNGRRIRVAPITPSAADKQPDERPSKRSGWIDLTRIKLSVNPPLEWKQMFRELWRLQRDHYWTADMAGIDWEAMYRRYLPLLDRIATRIEFSDLVWELHGELGTSHAYESGGDQRRYPFYRQGFLGADFSYDHKSSGYRIDRIIEGDSWIEQADSPLSRPGANIAVGDTLLAINGHTLSKDKTPNELLVNLAEQEVQLTIQRCNDGIARTINVKALTDETSARYRQWVEHNKKMVHEATNGRIGYVHLPNMGPVGFAEFHRYYFREMERDGLIVDVRFNGGGHVSQLILEKLARKRIAYTIKRWGQPTSYPHSAVLGPMIAITNEYAGSDGDIFSHSFKLMKLGKLVGKRTWGGVIGVWPRHRLVDGTVTTQPEFSFWFADVGWKVENYGTDPDVEVEITPQDYRELHDPQLQKCIELITEALKNHPVSMPAFDNRPRLAFP